jgi:predicted DNA-binding transcriptional regulator AlpA
MEHVAPNIAESTPRLMTQRQLAQCLKVSSRTLERWRAAGTGPEFIRLGKLVRYQADHVSNWLEGGSSQRDCGPSDASTAASGQSRR